MGEGEGAGNDFGTGAVVAGVVDPGLLVRAGPAAGAFECDFVALEFDVVAGFGFGGAATGIAFITRGDSSGLMVSLITSTGGLAHVTGMLRCTSRFTVAISRCASSE